LEIEKIGKQTREIIDALKELKIQTVILYPNNDAGSQDIIEEIKKVKKLSFIRIFPTLSHGTYINLLRHASVLIGNSSSGMMEAPTMKLPTVNIGLRNTGREHAENIIFIEANKIKILKAIKKALYNKEFRRKVKTCKNPYGDGRASNKIIKIISEMKINKKLLHKKMIY